MVESTVSKDAIVGFDKRVDCEMYNSYSNVGLSIIRPNRKELQLKKITKNNITVFYPFIRNGKPYDEPENVALEYLYKKEQEIRITR